MEKSMEAAIESRKDWTAPELRKIDIAQVTALGLGVGADLIILGTSS